MPDGREVSMKPQLLKQELIRPSKSNIFPHRVWIPGAKDVLTPTGYVRYCMAEYSPEAKFTLSDMKVRFGCELWAMRKLLKEGELCCDIT